MHEQIEILNPLVASATPTGRIGVVNSWKEPHGTQKLSTTYKRYHQES